MLWGSFSSQSCNTAREVWSGASHSPGGAYRHNCFKRDTEPAEDLLGLESFISTANIPRLEEKTGLYGRSCICEQLPGEAELRVSLKQCQEPRESFQNQGRPLVFLPSASKTWNQSAGPSHLTDIARFCVWCQIESRTSCSHKATTLQLRSMFSQGILFV